MSDKPVKFDTNQVKTEAMDSSKFDSVESVLHEKEKQLPVEANSVKLKKAKSKSKLLKLFGISFSALVISAAVYQAWQFIQDMFAINSVLGIAISALVTLTIVTGIGAFIKGWFKGRRLDYRKKIRKELKQYDTIETYGKAQGLLDEVSLEFQQEVDISKSLALYRQTAQKTHNDSELIQIYSDQVLDGLDRLALEAINKHAAEAALMVALSPLAIADMALVAWRSSRMIQQISRIYGCPQTAFGRLGLTKQVATNLMLAGASEFVAEAGVELLGKSVAASISTKMAQGIGVGILISRLGIQTMQLCRPVEFTAENKPKLSQIRKVLTSKVISMVGSGNKDKTLKQGEQND